jgi:peptidoglycan hydrolase-like protein with peptidoglycan-binding domain
MRESVSTSQVRAPGLAAPVDTNAARAAAVPAEATSVLLRLQRTVGNTRVGELLVRSRVHRLPQQDEGAGRSGVGELPTRGPEDADEVPLEVEQRIQGARGGGQALPPRVREEMETAFQRDFRSVRMHTGTEADSLSRAVGARAFTTGDDIFFREGESAPGTAAGRKLLAHELTHVVQQTALRSVRRKLVLDEPGDEYEREAERVAAAVSSGVRVGLRGQEEVGHERLYSLKRFRIASGHSLMRQAGPLTPAEVAAAIAWTRARYDERSVRIIQVITGTGVDGIFGRLTAQAVANWQVAQGQPGSGRVEGATLDAMIADRVATNRHEHAVQLVTDFFNLVTADTTLSIRYDAALAAPAAVTFESGGVRAIRVGLVAFADAVTLRNAIQGQLAVAPPAAPVPGPRPAVLSRAAELNAITSNRSRFRDDRAVRIIQGLAGSNPDARWGPDTVQRVAEWQGLNPPLVSDGVVGPLTLEAMVVQLRGAGEQNSAIRLILDYYNIRDDGNLLDVYYDPAVAANAETDYRPDEPVRVRLGPSGMNQPFAGVVHTIAHEFEHVRRLKQGIVPAATHEFLGEAVEILSVGMPEEELETLPPGAAGYVAGFADDAWRALNNWNAMPLADQRRFRTRFIAVRNRVRVRIAAGTPAQQALHAPLLAGYNAVVLPPP